MKRRALLRLLPAAALLAAALPELGCVAAGHRQSIAAGPDSREGLTTVVIVRHAERGDEDPVNPSITAEGRKRAEKLAKTFERARVDVLFASDLKRTQETLAPLAAAKRLPIRPLKEAREVVEAIQRLPAGSLAVIAHHSHLMKEILLGVGVAAAEVEAVKVDVYDNFFIVARHLSRREGLKTQLVNLTY